MKFVAKFSENNGRFNANMGDWIRGPQGPQGEKGETGPQGPQGEKGETGPSGKDAPQDVIRYSEQALTDAQQAQARSNIGASSAREVGQLKDDLDAETRRAKEAEDNRIKKFYTNNLGATSIADSDDGAVRNLVIGGRCEQRTTKGINLYHYEDIGIKKEKNGITFTSVENDGISIVGTSTDNANSSGAITPYLKNLVNGKAYVCKTFDDDVSVNFVLHMKDGTILYHNKINFDSETMDKVYPYFGVGMGITIDTVIYPMVCEEELSSNPYEPYTGGAPSPSPDYPQEIRCVEGCTMTVSSADGTETQQAAIPVTLRGIGNVRDELIVYEDGTGKLVQRIRYRAITNDDIFMASGMSTDKISNFSVRTLLDLKPQSGVCNIICNEFSRGKNQVFNVENTVFSAGNYNDKLYFCVSANVASTVDDFANFVAQRNIEVMYEIRPEETMLTSDQVQALYDLRTHYSGTNIIFDSDNGVEPHINFDYACALDAFVEYVKEQQGDTRTMIYDMDDRLTQAEVTALEAAIDTQIMAAMMEV